MERREVSREQRCLRGHRRERLLGKTNTVSDTPRSLDPALQSCRWSRSMRNATHTVKPLQSTLYTVTALPYVLFASSQRQLLAYVECKVSECETRACSFKSPWLAASSHLLDT